jgi:hypothetical protein
MKPIKKFTLAGAVGYVYEDGTVIWYTVHCHIDSLGPCGLKTAALNAKPITRNEHGEEVITLD